MKKTTLKKLINTANPIVFKELLATEGLFLHYYSDEIMNFALDYLELLYETEDREDLYKILEPKIEYDIKKYKTKLKELIDKNQRLPKYKEYNSNTVYKDLKNLQTQLDYLKYSSGYEYGKYAFILWFRQQLRG